MFQKSDRKAFWVPCKGHGACAQREQTGLISYRLFRINVYLSNVIDTEPHLAMGDHYLAYS